MSNVRFFGYYQGTYSQFVCPVGVHNRDMVGRLDDLGIKLLFIIKARMKDGSVPQDLYTPLPSF